MTAASRAKDDDVVRGLALKSPWKSPRGGFGDMQQQQQQQRRTEVNSLPPPPRQQRRNEVNNSHQEQKTPSKVNSDDQGVPTLSKTLSDFSITRPSRYIASNGRVLAETSINGAAGPAAGWQDELAGWRGDAADNSKAQARSLGYDHANLPQTTPPRISRTVLASPFKSGGGGGGGTTNNDLAAARWEVPLVTRQRWRARSGSNSTTGSGYGIAVTRGVTPRLDATPSDPMVTPARGLRNDAGRSLQVREDVADASSPCFVDPCSSMTRHVRMWAQTAADIGESPSVVDCDRDRDRRSSLTTDASLPSPFLKRVGMTASTTVESLPSPFLKRPTAPHAPHAPPLITSDSLPSPFIKQYRPTTTMHPRAALPPPTPTPATTHSLQSPLCTLDVEDRLTSPAAAVGHFARSRHASEGCMDPVGPLQTAFALPRRSLDMGPPPPPPARVQRPSFTQRKSAPAPRLKDIRAKPCDNGRSSPAVDDIFFDHPTSSSSSISSNSSPIHVERQAIARPRLLKRRTTSGESSGWTLASKRSMSSSNGTTAPIEISMTAPAAARDSGVAALSTSEHELLAGEVVSPLGARYGHGHVFNRSPKQAVAPHVEESPVQLSRKRPSPVTAEDPTRAARKKGLGDVHTGIIAPRASIFHHINVPATGAAAAATFKPANPARTGTPDHVAVPPRTQTPVPAFVQERPSPFAFVTSGLVKKGTPSSSSISHRSIGSSSMGSALASSLSKSMTAGEPPSHNGSRHRMPPSALASSVTIFKDMPDTPIKVGTIARVEGLPEVLPRGPSALAAFVATNRPLSIAVPTTADLAAPAPPHTRSSSNGSRGLRRKRSTMWARTHSGSFSSGSWNGGSDGFEPEPTTPTREEDLAAFKMQEMCTVTPSPPAHVRTYPFADGAGAKTKSHLSADSPSPPHKRFSILSRLKSAKQQRPLSRPSNPLLSLAYKIGGEQQARGLVSASRSPGKDDISQGRFEQDFVVLQPVGQGEFSTVWKVRGKRTGEIFAVKRGKAFTGGKDRQRQLQEVTILETLSAHPHPHVVEFYGAWEQNQQLHIQTAFAECGDLATYLESVADRGGLGEIRCWKTLTELACGLRHIHSLSILHLDLKPSNILITTAGSLCIGDFGLSARQGETAHSAAHSRQLGPSESTGSLREGDREYLSPEVLRGVFGKAADAYSLGITMLEAYMNITLPSNGDAWQKLRWDDFSDLDEHFATSSSKTPTGMSFGAISTSLSSSLSSSVSSSMTYAENGGRCSAQPSPDSALLSMIKSLMRSDPHARATVESVWSHTIVRRIAGMLPSCVGSRMSFDAPSDASVDEWQRWQSRRRRSFDMDLSPDATKVEFIGREGATAQPALVVEDDAELWADVLML